MAVSVRDDVGLVRDLAKLLYVVLRQNGGIAQTTKAEIDRVGPLETVEVERQRDGTMFLRAVDRGEKLDR